MCAANPTVYDRADSCRGYINSTDGMARSHGNVERITALRDRTWPFKRCLGADTVCIDGGIVARECGDMPRLRLRRRIRRGAGGEQQ